jgi:hypothetical protein
MHLGGMNVQGEATDLHTNCNSLATKIDCQNHYRHCTWQVCAC